MKDEYDFRNAPRGKFLVPVSPFDRLRKDQRESPFDRLRKDQKGNSYASLKQAQWSPYQQLRTYGFPDVGLDIFFRASR